MTPDYLDTWPERSAYGKEPARQALRDVTSERLDQDMKWGVQHHPDLYWLGILMEEVGELAQAIVENQPYIERESELIQVAAVAVAWLEARHSEAVSEAVTGDGVTTPEDSAVPLDVVTALVESRVATLGVALARQLSTVLDERLPPARTEPTPEAQGTDDQIKELKAERDALEWALAVEKGS